MIIFFSLYVTLKQDYLHFIHLHFFPFFYFKTSKQGYLIRFHSIPFFSVLFSYLNTFHSISFNSIHFHSFMIITLYSISFLYELSNKALRPLIHLNEMKKGNKKWQSYFFAEEGFHLFAFEICLFQCEEVQFLYWSKYN